MPALSSKRHPRKAPSFELLELRTRRPQTAKSYTEFSVNFLLILAEFWLPVSQTEKAFEKGQKQQVCNYTKSEIDLPKRSILRRTNSKFHKTHEKENRKFRLKVHAAFLSRPGTWNRRHKKTKEALSKGKPKRLFQELNQRDSSSSKTKEVLSKGKPKTRSRTESERSFEKQT